MLVSSAYIRGWEKLRLRKRVVAFAYLSTYPSFRSFSHKQFLYSCRKTINSPALFRNSSLSSRKYWFWKGSVEADVTKRVVVTENVLPVPVTLYDSSERSFFRARVEFLTNFPQYLFKKTVLSDHREFLYNFHETMYNKTIIEFGFSHIRGMIKVEASVISQGLIQLLFINRKMSLLQLLWAGRNEGKFANTVSGCVRHWQSSHSQLSVV